MYKLITFITILLISNIAYAGNIYTCESDSGAKYIQDRPCKKEQKTLKKEIAKVKINYSLLTDLQEFYINSYFLSEESKVMLAECKIKAEDLSETFAYNLKRYNEISEYDISKGRRLVSSGTRNVSSSDLKQFLQQEKERTSEEVKTSSPKVAESLCRERSVFLPMAAANSPNRASGYAEGDLDPEGND